MLSHSSGNGDIPEIRVDDSTPEGLLESNADDAQQLDVLFAWFAPAVRQGAHQLLSKMNENAHKAVELARSQCGNNWKAGSSRAVSSEEVPQQSVSV